MAAVEIAEARRSRSVGIDQPAPAAGERQGPGAGIVDEGAVGGQDDSIAGAAGGHGSVERQAAAGRAVHRADLAGRDRAERDGARSRVGLAGAVPQLDIDRSGARINCRSQRDHGRPGIALGIDDAIGEAVVAVVCGDRRVDENAASGLQSEMAAIARRIIRGDRAVDGDVVGGLQGQGRARIELARDRIAADRHVLRHDAVEGQRVEITEADIDTAGCRIVRGACDEDVVRVAGRPEAEGAAVGRSDEAVR